MVMWICNYPPREDPCPGFGRFTNPSPGRTAQYPCLRSNGLQHIFPFHKLRNGKHAHPVKKQCRRRPQKNHQKHQTHRQRSFGIERHWCRKGQLIPSIMSLICGIMLLVMIGHVAMRISAEVQTVPFPSSQTYLPRVKSQP